MMTYGVSTMQRVVVATAEKMLAVKYHLLFVSLWRSLLTRVAFFSSLRHVTHFLLSISLPLRLYPRFISSALECAREPQRYFFPSSLTPFTIILLLPLYRHFHCLFLRHTTLFIRLFSCHYTSLLAAVVYDIEHHYFASHHSLHYLRRASFSFIFIIFLHS